MNYKEAIDYIESLAPNQVRPGLERFAAFMKQEGNIQDKSPVLHVAGTNGKGSVVSMLAQTLCRSGLKTGKYTGPHLISFNERYQISEHTISDNELAAVCSRIRNLSEQFGRQHPEFGQLSWFEVITAITFFYFANEKVDASVLEVGLGGRYDATNVVSSPVATAVVTVSLDHTHLLGPTIAEIAGEKAGIIKNGIPVVTACTGEALAVILNEAQNKQAPVICVDELGNLRAGLQTAQERQYIDQLEKKFLHTSVPVRESIERQAGYQRLNSSVAAAVLGLWELNTGIACLDNFEQALANFFWPGRLQYFQGRQLLLDGAHNSDGARALRKSIDELFPSQRRCFILSFYRTKHFKQILSMLLKPGDVVLASQTSGRRPVVPGDEIVTEAVALGAHAKSFPDLPSAFSASEEQFGDKYLRIACGSFASVIGGLKYIGYKYAEDSRIDSSSLWQPSRTY